MYRTKLFFSIILLSTIISCRQKNALFYTVPSAHSGIHFNNLIVENDSINALDIVNVYNGGGVGIGDFNNDGLQDIYFTGNLVSNKLYLNRGDFKFEDITDKSNTGGEGKWSRGIAVVDINNDGFLDMYVCNTIAKDPIKRENVLYINKGTDKNGVPHFINMAAEYGLNDTTHSTMAAFFDYDNDSDLDMYLTVNVIPEHENPGAFRNVFKNGEHPSTGRLYQNDWSEKFKHAVFTNVSKQAGITIEGYGHSASVADINNDGWKDIYVANDFLPDNILYINNHDGTFTNKVKDYFKHTSNNSMGQDIIDINNDGLQDVIELDMNPEDNYRKKTMMNGNNYLNYQNFDKYGHQYQYVRNVLQLNQGPRLHQHDSIGEPVFSDVSYFSGIAETDWSWAPVVTDFDNDGYRDIIITNGFPKDVTDHDFIAFRDEAVNLASKETLLEEIPEVKLHNYAYQNNGDLTFKDVSNQWGLSVPTFSNGAAYADLDNDGDMDLVINNINDEAALYKNTLKQNEEKNDDHFIQIKLIGDSLNLNGLGAKISIYYKGQQQIYEQTPYRGYLSTVQLNPHFGLGTVASIDSLIIIWPGGKMQKLVNIPTDKTLYINIKNANEIYNWSVSGFDRNTLFTEVTDSLNIHFIHQQNDLIDFNIQKLLPHKLSEFGPSLSAGDIDGNGLDDMIIGGTSAYCAQIFLQQPDNTFIQKSLFSKSIISPETTGDDMGLLLFDADSDGDNDLYIARGGYTNKPNSESYQDKLYINDGKGNYNIDSLALPENFTSKSCVRAVDYDKDGDLDLFVAGRVLPWIYPKPVSSFIYRNDFKNGRLKFTDVTSSIAKSLNNIGLVCDAVWTDFDNDGWQDLILAGEWMPLQFLKNNKGIFMNVSSSTGLANDKGFWNSIIPGDFDNDGDIDYIAGNVGENTFYRGTDKYPVSIYGKDFDNNGVFECIPTKYLKNNQGVLGEYTTHTRDDVVDQLPFIKKKFLTYKKFAEATIDKLFTPEQLSGALKLQANYFKSAFIKNNGNGNFEISALPVMAQLSFINGMVVDDFDADGNLDVLISGNDYGTEVSVGRYDALSGLMLKGNGKGGFIAKSILQSGIYIPGNAKALVKLRAANNNYLVAASQNRGSLKVFEANNTNQSQHQNILLNPDDETAMVSYIDGRVQRHEFNYGSSFLSQSSRFLILSKDAKSATIVNSKGKKRVITVN